MQTLISSNLLWSEGIYIVYGVAIALVLGYFLSRTLVWSAIFVFLFSFYFFRNPERICDLALKDASVLVCPADGTVVDVQYVHDSRMPEYGQRISIFLSPLDVHVQWIPMAGIVEKVTYTPGTFKFAFLPKSSELNEHNDVIMSDEKRHKKIMVRQIAGFVARRISCWVHEKEELSAGQKYGMIKFGSRVDVYLPSEVEIAVGVGQKVVGGHTVLGKLK